MQTDAYAPNHESETAPHRFALPLDEHPTLEIETDFAQVRVVPTRNGEAPYLEVEGGAPPRVEVTARSGETRVRIGGAWRALEEKLLGGKFWEAAFWEKRHWKGTDVRVVVHVPASVRARVRSAAGRVRVEHLQGCDLLVETEAGAITLDEVAGRIRARTEAGKIDGHALAGSLDVATSAGAVHLDVLSLDPGAHRVRTNMGAIRVELARGLPVRIDARTTMGATRIDVPQVRDAAAVLDLEADLGAIRVAPSGRAWSGETHDAPKNVSSTSSDAPVEAGPYRTGASPSQAPDEAEVQRVLERVADGSLSPADARALLRALGVA